MSQIKAAIVYLTRFADISDLKQSLSLLEINFQYKYPIIIFHDDLDEISIANIKESTKSYLQFEKIEFNIPKFLLDIDIPNFFNFLDLKFSIDYRHMCRFFAGEIYKHSCFKDLEYYWRLDTDSFILHKITYDIFEFMKNENYYYGYISIQKDPQEVVENLWNVTKKYIKNNKIQSEFLYEFIQNEEWNRNIFYTNFEVSKVDFWRSKQVTDFFCYLDHTGGIYKYRWGDAPIHLLTVAMFLLKNQTHKFTDISYQHQGFKV